MKAMIVNGTPHIAYAYLEQLGVSAGTLKAGLHRSRTANGSSWQSVKENGLVFFKLDSIPQSTRQKFNLDGDIIVAQLRAQVLTELVNLNISDLDFFMMLDLDIPKKVGKMYQYQAGWMRLLSTLKKKDKAYWLESKGKWHKLTAFNSSSEIWDSALFAMKSADLIKHFKVKSGKGLWNRVSKWKKASSEDQALRSLVHGSYGNENRKIVGKSSNSIVDQSTGEVLGICPHQAIIYSLWMNIGQPNKLTRDDIYIQYCEKIRYMGIEPVTYQTVCNHVGKFSSQFLTSMERHGYSYFQEQHNTFVPASKPKHSNVMVASDGSSVKMYYKSEDKQGKWQRANAYAIRVVDLYSDCIIGFSISTTETGKAVKEAIKMAINAGENRGFGEFLTDNGGAFRGAEGREIIDMVSQKTRRISITKKAKNGAILHHSNKQSNPAEAFVKYLSSKARKYPNWIAVGRNAKSADNRTNADYMPSLEELPTLPELRQQFINLIAEFNSDQKNGTSRYEKYINGFNEKAEVISDVSVRYLFAQYRTEATVNRGFMKIKGNLYELPGYESHLSKFDKYGTKVKVIVSSDWAVADLYSEDDVYLLTANLTQRTAKAVSEQTKATAQSLKHHQERKETLEQKSDDFIDSVTQAVSLLEESYDLTAKFSDGRAKKLSNAIAEQSFLTSTGIQKSKTETQPMPETEADEGDEYFNV